MPPSSRIDRRLDIAAAPERIARIGPLVAFRTPWGDVAQEFDCAKLHLPGALTNLFADAFRARHATAAAATRTSCWKALHTFARFIAEDGGIASANDLGEDAMGRYIAWLDQRRTSTGEPWSLSTRHRRFMHVKLLLDWLTREHRIAPIDFPHNPFPGRHVARPQSRLSPMQLKAILRACYEEIDAAWARFEQGRAILAQPHGAGDPGALLRDLDQRGGGVMPRLETLNDLKSRIHRNGGASALAQHLHLTVETLTPFFLAIAIQTAANPDALRLITCDCLVQHPLDLHRTMIDWAKPRAGGAIRRAQRRSFDRRRPNAAPNLIDKVLSMTAPIRPHASIGERSRLFLVRGTTARGVSVIAEQTLRYGVQRFIARANRRIAEWNAAHPSRPRTMLPRFAPNLFRGSVATQHYVHSGGDIRAAQVVLNHARADTTDLYVRGPETQRLQDATVARLQKLMLAWIVGEQSAGNAKDAPAVGDMAHAFGHVCANPLVGSAPYSEAGRICPSFAGCLACPGLVIPIDAEHLARILQAKLTLEAARERIDAQRWRLLYASSYRILTEDILPDFPSHLHEAARLLMASLPPMADIE